jgi:hypothetical protein
LERLVCNLLDLKTTLKIMKNGKTIRRETPFKTLDGRKLDRGIAREVKILFENGIDTTESCEGGQGHSFPEPTVCFAGGQAEGFRALGIALQNGLKVTELRRAWSVQDGEPVSPQWEMTFYHRKGMGGSAIIKKDGTDTWFLR